MFNALPLKLMAGILAGSVLLSGCSGKNVPPGNVNGGSTPTLVVPTKFNSDEEKQAFALKAVDDGFLIQAKPLLQELTTSHPNANAFSRLGLVDFSLENYPAAISSWTKAGELDDRLLGDMLNNIGNALRDSNKLPEAEESYRKALKVEPTQWTAAVNLATILNLKGNREESIKVLKSALVSNKDNPSLVKMLQSIKTE